MTDKKMREIERSLNEIIMEALGGPGGDPMSESLYVAAKAFKTLESLGLNIEDRDSVFLTLSEDNIYEENFLE